MQIFVKTLSFGTITLHVKDTDTISRVKKMTRDKLDDMTQGLDTELLIDTENELIFEGKLLESKRTVQSYNIKIGSTLRMVFGLDGGGKRGSTSVAEQSNGTKETITEDIMDNIGMLERVIGDVSGNPHMLGLLNRSQHIAGVADTGEEVVRGLNRDRLKRLKDGLDTTNVEYKAIAVKSHFFAQEVVTIKGFKNTIQSLEEHMTAVSKLICVKSFSNPKGEVQWWQLKNIIDDQIATLDKMAGAAAAGAAMPEGWGQLPLPQQLRE